MKYRLMVPMLNVRGVVPLRVVAEAMATHEATLAGTAPFHEVTWRTVLPRHQEGLLRAAKEGALPVCDAHGHKSDASTLIEATPIPADWGMGEIGALYVKVKHLVDWGQANGDEFEFMDAPVKVIEYEGTDAAGNLVVNRGVVSAADFSVTIRDENPSMPPAQAAKSNETSGVALMPEVSVVDWKRWATPDALLEAFGVWGLHPQWFNDLQSHKWLRDARRLAGRPQRAHTVIPMYCPYAVMNGLINKVTKKKRISVDAGWRVLQHKFPLAYERFATHDPRDP